MPSQTFTTPGSFSFTIPTGVFLVDSEDATGAGDGGGSSATDGSADGNIGGAGGNWGGATNAAVVPGDTFTGTIGTGGTGASGGGGGGGTATATVSLFSGTVGNNSNGGGGTFNGGNGAGNDGSGGNGGGGGGGAATSGGAGTDGSQGSGDSGGIGGATNGGSGGDRDNNGGNGANPGGAGGGAGGDGNGGAILHSGGNGGNGQVIESWTSPTTVINLVQRIKDFVNGATTKSVSFTTNPTAGNALVVSVTGYSSASMSSISVTDNQSGNTYTQAVFLRDATNGEFAGIWSCPHIASSGTFTVTFSYTGTSGEIRICVQEIVYPGGTTFSLDQHSSNNATTISPAPGSVTTTHNNEYLVACCSVIGNAVISVIPTNYNDIYMHTTGLSQGDSECRQVSASSGFNPTWTLFSSVPWVAVQATFSAVATGGVIDNEPLSGGMEILSGGLA